MTPGRARARSGRPLAWTAAVDLAAVLAVWGAALIVEDIALGYFWRDEFAGIWEIVLARRAVAPIALVASLPVAIVVVAGWWLARRAAGAEGAEGSEQGARTAGWILGAAGGAAALAFGLGVTEGRHFASWGARAPFVSMLTMLGAALGKWAFPRVPALGRHPAVLAALGLAVALGAWLADARVLPRLYPAFHVAMLATCLFGLAAAAMAGREGAPAPRAVARACAAAMGVVLVACAALAPRGARALAPATNLRIVLDERAPLLGRGVRVATWLAPPDSGETADTGTAATAPAAPGEVTRALDWTGRDLVLLSVDALRADHVSAYGYARPTTPNIDALAARGARFESAYCPTPHTSYSLTSLMTGKYLRPLLTLGLGEDSETWAQALRRYGWRTAAFYPPAVFFIDEDRFTRFEEGHLGFEYAKVEFADPALREAQVGAYLDGAGARAPTDRPLFLWVHFFEPHEPYVMHPEHPFSGGASPDVDAYDSEVATADDGIGRIVRRVQARRPGAVVIVTADHGEEFGEHGGRYHGTTVYDEQVRVPLVVVGPGVAPGARIATVVQTIDLLPTALSALGIPRPARVRGRDLGPVLSVDPKAPADADGARGRAFVETDDYELLASGPDRLVCQRRLAACALYRPADDPLERRDRAGEDPARFAELRAELRATGRDHGRYESAEGGSWPEPIRRGLQGEVDAAPDAASLLDDADVAIRRKAAEVCFELHAPVTAPEVKRAAVRDEDDEVRRWAALAAARMAGDAPAPLVEGLLRDPDRAWRERAALAMGERGDGRACGELASWWGALTGGTAFSEADPDGQPPRLALDLSHTRDLLGATTRARCRAAVPALVRALADVRARPHVADALGALGDDRARAPLLAMLGAEPYLTTRPHEARALLALGAGVVQTPGAEVHVVAPAGPVRLAVLLADPEAELGVTGDDGPVAPAMPVTRGGSAGEGEVRVLELPPGDPKRGSHLGLRASTGSILGFWLVPARAGLD